MKSRLVRFRWRYVPICKRLYGNPLNYRILRLINWNKRLSITKKKLKKTNFLSLKNAGIINVHIQNRKKRRLNTFPDVSRLWWTRNRVFIGPINRSNWQFNSFLSSVYLSSRCSIVFGPLSHYSVAKWLSATP